MSEKKGLLKGNVGESQNQSNSDLNALNAVEEYWESSVGSNLN
ncbi:MAG TPA: dTDP-6-deoxy-L-hexose 3-O-methyltransferase, partial [Planctomycetaceae bacterium]|nr:dTDP-6-deoxy-L-hexose 3-O-methyltransferase [Planctomycetaceae bacterium]